MTTNNSVDVGLSGSTGSGKFVGQTSPAITTPSITTSINDANGNQIINLSSTTSAVNYLEVGNNSTGLPINIIANGSDSNVGMNLSTKGTGSFSFFSNISGSDVLFAIDGAVSSPVNYVYVTPAATTISPSLSAIGTDTNISLTLNGKGTGGVAVSGTSTNDSASAGYVGEFISSSVLLGSAVSLTTATAKNITSITLTAGDWNVWGNVTLEFSITGSSAIAWSSTTSATLPDYSLVSSVVENTSALTLPGVTIPYQRYSVSSTTTVYLSAYAAFAAGTCVGCGNIYARRAR